MNLKLTLLSVAVTSVVLFGCASGEQTTTEVNPAETTTATQVATVAADGVVRDAKGDAYCVVMKESVPKASEAEYPKTTVDGVTYIFCCESCPGVFAKEPAKFAVKK